MQEGGNGFPGGMGGASLKGWASTPSGPQTRMETLHPGEAEGTLRHPFATVQRDAYLQMIKGNNVAQMTHNAPVALVNLRDVVGIQNTVNRERLGHHLDDPSMYAPGTRASGHGALIDRPIVVRKDGKLYCHDGHHRLTAAWLRGDTTAKVRFVDLDAR